MTWQLHKYATASRENGVTNGWNQWGRRANLRSKIPKVVLCSQRTSKQHEFSKTRAGNLSCLNKGMRLKGSWWKQLDQNNPIIEHIHELVIARNRVEHRIDNKTWVTAIGKEFLKELIKFWALAVWFGGLSTSLRTKGSRVWFPVRAHAWVEDHVPSRGRVTGNHTSMFLSLSSSLPLSLKINE